MYKGWHFAGGVEIMRRLPALETGSFRCPQDTARREDGGQSWCSGQRSPRNVLRMEHVYDDILARYSCRILKRRRPRVERNFPLLSGRGQWALRW
jgi:hypothetical protein